MVTKIPGYYSKNLCERKDFKPVLLKVILLSRNWGSWIREEQSPPLRWEGPELSLNFCHTEAASLLFFMYLLDSFLILFATLLYFCFSYLLLWNNYPPNLLAMNTNYRLASLGSLGWVGSAEQFFCCAWHWLELWLSGGSYELEQSRWLIGQAGDVGL